MDKYIIFGSYDANSLLDISEQPIDNLCEDFPHIPRMMMFDTIENIKKTISADICDALIKYCKYNNHKISYFMINFTKIQNYKYYIFHSLPQNLKVYKFNSEDKYIKFFTNYKKVFNKDYSELICYKFNDKKFTLIDYFVFNF